MFRKHLIPVLILACFSTSIAYPAFGQHEGCALSHIELCYTGQRDQKPIVCYRESQEISACTVRRICFTESKRLAPSPNPLSDICHALNDA